MTASAVEWVLVIYYGVTVHKATYGRLSNASYSKDYIQLYRTKKFLNDLPFAFAASEDEKKSIPLTFRWPKGSAPGTLFRRSADRPHLTWETSKGAPQAWRMALTSGDDTAETIPGNPGRDNAAGANEEFAKFAERGAGQPYLMAVKLRDQPDVLHLRAYLHMPSPHLSWADSRLLPSQVQGLLAQASAKSNLAWMNFASGADSEPLLFDPDKNHDAWGIAAEADPDGAIAAKLAAMHPASLDSDGAAEALLTSQEETDIFRARIEDGDFEVDDTTSSVKVRGSAQRAFSEKVKRNYEWRCAVSGISTRSMLVGAHIVPWSQDKKIRLDPANGICLSVFFDKVFELGLILINDDLTISVRWDKVGADAKLAEALEAYEGKKLRSPLASAPRADFLRRRRDLSKAAPS